MDFASSQEGVSVFLVSWVAPGSSVTLLVSLFRN